jgi:hypothetical protein
MVRAFLACGLLVGCGRPAAASLLPTLQLGVRFTLEGDDYDERISGGNHLVGFARLAFRARSAASALPAESDASGLSLSAPCAEGDAVCLEELAEAERELAGLADQAGSPVQPVEGAER